MCRENNGRPSGQHVISAPRLFLCSVSSEAEPHLHRGTAEKAESKAKPAVRNICITEQAEFMIVEV